MPTQKSRKRTWIIVLASIAGLAVFGTVVLVGLGVVVVMNNVNIDDATPEMARLSFQEARAPFVGEAPLIRLTRENGDIQVEVLRRDQPSDVRPRWLHVMVWDPSEERLVNVRVPLWLLRFGDNATVNFSETDGDVVGDLDLTLDDLDHHGPGLVLDYQDADRERVLLWAE